MPSLQNMTAPTIEQMIKELRAKAWQSSRPSKGKFNSQHICAIAANWIEKQSQNTLPLDEVPDGWRISQIAYYSNSNNDDLYICDLIRRADAELVCSNAMPTPAEALRAAIAKAREA